MKRRLRLKYLTEQPVYQDIKDVCAEIATAYGAPLPTNPMAVVGFVTFSIVRDVLNELFARIETEAKAAPTQEFDQ